MFLVKNLVQFQQKILYEGFYNYTCNLKNEIYCVILPQMIIKFLFHFYQMLGLLSLNYETVLEK